MTAATSLLPQNRPSAQPLVTRFVEHLTSAPWSRVVVEGEAAQSDTGRLWAQAQRHRAVLRALGLRRGDVIVLGLPTCTGLLATLLAAWAEGVAISLVPHEVAAQHSARLAPSKWAQMLTLVAPALLLLAPALAEHVPAALRHRVLTLETLHQQALGLEAVTEGPQAQPGDTAILQFTSGSTGGPKAAVISQAMLSANCAAIAGRVEVGATDRMLSWLPMHHDMGLSAVTLAWWCGIDLVMLPTALFVRQPLCWIEAISVHRATLSPAPASAYAVLARFAHAAAQRRLDLSSWRYAWAGAEPVFHKHMQHFIQQMQALGLREGVLQPAYGMAESVVAVSLNTPGQPYRVLWLDAQQLKLHGRALPCAAVSEGAVACVSNGRPVQGIEIEVRDANGHPAGECCSGTVHIRGSSVIRHYLGLPDACDELGWFDTGDIGFLHQGEVFISGRAKDLITRSGLNVSPQELEWAVEELLSLREGSVAAFSYIEPAQHQERVVVVVAKRPEASEADRVRREIAVAVASGSGIQLNEVIFVQRSSLPKTTSGKIQRAALRNAHLRGELPSLI